MADAPRSRAHMVYGQDYDGIWSSLIPWLSLLINGRVLGECLRWSRSTLDPRISPLTTAYRHPRPPLFLLGFFSKMKGTKKNFLEKKLSLIPNPSIENNKKNDWRTTILFEILCLAQKIHPMLSVFMTKKACFEHLNFFKVKVSRKKKRDFSIFFLKILKGLKLVWVVPSSRGIPSNLLALSPFPCSQDGNKKRKEKKPNKKGPSWFQTLKSDYELFNCNNFNIH